MYLTRKKWAFARMYKRQNHIYYQFKILFVAILTLCGCSTIRPSGRADKSKAKNAIIQEPKITKDVLNFIDLKEIDLNNDGEKEIVAIYNAGLNLRGVKVIKINNQAGRKVIFSKVFNTNDLRFKVRNGVFTLIVKERDSAGCGLNKFYVWEGKEFRQMI